MKMMIVDDSMFIRSKIARETSLDGLEKIISARNGVEAVKLFRDTLPELVTMDLTMTEMDGVECIKELIKIKPDVIILVISALADKGIAATRQLAKRQMTWLRHWPEAHVFSMNQTRDLREMIAFVQRIADN